MIKALLKLGSLIGVLVLLASSPLVAMAARTAAPVLTGIFPSTLLSITLPSPSSFSLGQATTTGSLYASTLYFAVTALDGVGETVPSTALGTTTVDQAHGYVLTWVPTPGAFSYRVYFSTSTPQAFTQYFTATTTGQYTFTSTSSPTYVAAGIPTAGTAYVDNFVSNGNSWLNSGAFAIGTTTFPTGVQLQVGTTTATTTAMVGAKGISGGKWIFVDSVNGHATCTELSTNAGVGTFKAITCP